MSESGSNRPGDDDWGGPEETPWQQPPAEPQQPSQPPPPEPPEQPQQPTYGQQPPQYGAPSPLYGAPSPQYGAQPPQQFAGPPTHQPGEQLPNYLVHSILATVLCCLPAGIVGIVYASQVNGKLAAGDYAGAKKSSDQAKLWCIISVAAAFLFWVIYLAVAASLGGGY